MIEIKDFPKHLSSLHPEDWNRLFSLIDEIQKNQNFGTISIGEKNEDGSFRFPYYETAPIVDKLVQTLYALDLLPAFDWPSWTEGKNILGSRQSNFDSFDAVTLCMLLTAIVREDKFMEGYLIGCFENGTIFHILQALRKRIADSRAGGAG